MRLLAAVAAAAALLVFATTAMASPVATDDGTYTALGRVFPDPLAACSNSGGACSPYAQGNTPATQFIGIDEFVSAITYMNSKWPGTMEIETLDGKLGDGAGNGKNPDVPGNNLDPEFTPDASFVSAGLPTSTVERKKSDLMVVRVTDESVPDAGKKRYALSLSIHGIERAGAEGGTRAMEDLVTAYTTMAADGKPIADHAIVSAAVRKGAPTFRDVLRKTIIYFTYPNPDGWRRGSVSSGAEGGVFFQRYNGNGVDPNRDWPDIGYAFRGYSAVSEPETKAWISFYNDVRKNGGQFSAGDDLHGQPFADALSYTLLPHGRHRYDKNQRIQETAKAINKSTYDRISWSPIVQANDQPQGGDVGCAPSTPVGTPCSKIYAQTWGSVYDTINYTTTGALGDWFDSSIGLGADGIDNEMSFSHLDKNITFDPHTEQLHVDGNKALIYAHLTNILEPQYDSSFDVGGRKGYVPNKRVSAPASVSQPIAPAGSVTQDDITVGPQPQPVQSEFPFAVKRGPQSDGKNIFNGGMRVEATSSNAQGIGNGLVSLQIQCSNCDEHPGVKDNQEYVTVAEDYNQSPLYLQSGVVATVNHPQAIGRNGKPVLWRAVLGNAAGLATVKVNFTKGRASEDGDTGGGAAPEQRAYDVANTDFFKDLNPFIPGKAQDLDTIDPRAVIDGKQSLDGFDTIALADDPLPGYTGPYGGVSSGGPTGPPTPDFSFESQGSQPGLGSGAPGTFEEKEFTVGPNDGDKSATITITWADNSNDFDLAVDRVAPDGTRSQVGSSGQSLTTQEQVVLSSVTPGKYIIHVDNYASSDPAWKGTAKFEALPAKSQTASDFTEAEKDAWFKKLGDWVKGGGNLVLTDGALRALPELSSVPGTAVSQQTVYAGQSAFNKGDGNTLKDPLARNVEQPGARFNGGMRRQMYEPTPVGYAIQDTAGADQSNARQFDVDRAAWEQAGGRTVATSADSGARDAQAVTTRVTIGELPTGGGHIRIAGALLPQPTEKYDHEFGLEPYAVTYTGYVMARNLLEALNRASTPALRGTVGGRFVISRRAVKLRGGVARVRVSCRTPLGCVGTLRLAVKVKAGKKGKKRKLLRIGSKRFSYATKHRNALIKVKVSKRGRRIVARQKRRIKAHATAPVKFRDGLKGTAKRAFWLYRPSHVRHRK
jgi:hypothetical protein